MPQAPETPPRKRPKTRSRLLNSQGQTGARAKQVNLSNSDSDSDETENIATKRFKNSVNMESSSSPTSSQPTRRSPSVILISSDDEEAPLQRHPRTIPLAAATLRASPSPACASAAEDQSDNESDRSMNDDESSSSSSTSSIVSIPQKVKTRTVNTKHAPLLGGSEERRPTSSKDRPLGVLETKSLTMPLVTHGHARRLISVPNKELHAWVTRRGDAQFINADKRYGNHYLPVSPEPQDRLTGPELLHIHCLLAVTQKNASTTHVVFQMTWSLWDSAKAHIKSNFWT